MAMTDHEDGAMLNPPFSHKKEFVSPKGESCIRYRLLFPLHWQSGEHWSMCPMFDKEDVKNVMKASPALAEALKINSMRIDGIYPDGSMFIAATWSTPTDSTLIEKAKSQGIDIDKGGWKRWYLL